MSTTDTQYPTLDYPGLLAKTKAIYTSYDTVHSLYATFYLIERNDVVNTMTLIELYGMQGRLNGLITSIEAELNNLFALIDDMEHTHSQVYYALLVRRGTNCDVETSRGKVAGWFNQWRGWWAELEGMINLQPMKDQVERHVEQQSWMINEGGWDEDD
ncbi:unnamed protein product [Periconia digitata]|uniref:Uncharacterized protein n=1 Tax=Periconia digitata TaxID=1303443 RepID=A0A9W4XSD8_9PLEO|nr:unnamed protein product [Periconia digitata]